MDRQQEFVRTIEEREQFIRLWFTDVVGTSNRCARRLVSAFDEGFRL